MFNETEKKARIGQQIYRLRLDVNMKQSELADELKVSKDVVSKVELGKRYPSFTFLENLDYAFGITISDLLEAVPHTNVIDKTRIKVGRPAKESK